MKMKKTILIILMGLSVSLTGCGLLDIEEQIPQIKATNLDTSLELKTYEEINPVPVEINHEDVTKLVLTPLESKGVTLAQLPIEYTIPFKIHPHTTADMPMAVFEPNTQVMMDLDGDGTLEKLMYSCVDEINTLTVNGTALNLDEYATEWFAVADIDTNDTYKEILVSSYGPSSDFHTSYFRYVVQELIPMGSTESLFFDGITLTGNNTIEAYSKGKLLHSCFIPKMYEVKNHKIELIEQAYYPMKWSMTANCEILMYAEPNRESKILTVPIYSVVESTRTDDEAWCEFKWGNQTGWLYLDDFNHSDLNNTVSSHLFNELCFAD